MRFLPFGSPPHTTSSAAHATFEVATGPTTGAPGHTNGTTGTMSDSTRTKIAFGGLALSTALAVAIAQEPLRPVTSPAPSGGTAPAGQDRDAGPPAAVGAEAEPAPTQRGQAFEPLRPAGPAGQAPLQLDLEDAIVESLSVPDLDAREAAFDRWAERSVREEPVRRALEAIAADESDVDVAFTARLALREAERGVARSAPLRSRGVDAFDEMRRELERVFGADPFTSNASPFAGRRGFDPFAGRDPFQRIEPFWRGAAPGQGDLRERMDRMHAEIEEMLGGAPGLSRVGGSSGDWHSSGMSVEVHPDGVKVTITENGADGQETRTYEAPSIDELLEAHPELEGRIR